MGFNSGFKGLIRYFQRLEFFPTTKRVTADCDALYANLHSNNFLYMFFIPQACQLTDERLRGLSEIFQSLSTVHHMFQDVVEFQLYTTRS